MASAKVAAAVEAIPPKPDTLAKYGLTLGHWQLLLQAQGGVCAICRKLPKSGRFNIDHGHGHQRGKRWSQMAPEERRPLVRGLLCFLCNKYCVGRGVTIERLEAGARYLRRFEVRRPDARPQ
jgi:hypothetical protein